MLTPDYLLHCTDSLTELLDAYDNAVVSDIARRIVKTGYVTETAKHQLRQADCPADERHGQHGAGTV